MLEVVDRKAFCKTLKVDQEARKQVEKPSERVGRGQGRGEGVPKRRTRSLSQAVGAARESSARFRVVLDPCRDDSYLEGGIMVMACRRASFQLL